MPVVFWIGLDFFGFRIGSGFSFGLDKRDSVLGLDFGFSFGLFVFAGFRTLASHRLYKNTALFGEVKVFCKCFSQITYLCLRLIVLAT